MLDTESSIPANLQLEMYENNELDVVNLWSLPPADMARVQLKYSDDYRSVPGFGTKYIGFDLTRPPFDDVRVRRAFAMAINIETMADEVMGEFTFPATGGFVPQGMPGYSADIGLVYDPEQARRLLTEAGYPDGRDFPVVEWLVSHGHTQIVEYLQNQWRENLNIDIPCDAMLKDKKYYARLSKDPPHMYMMGWSADYPDPDNFLRASCVSSLTQWQNKAFNSLIEEARQVRDQGQRMKLYQQADKLLVEDAPIFPFFYTWYHFLVKPWVTGYPTSPIRPYFWEDTIIEPH